MANYENLKSAIQQVVKTNGNNAITGALLQQSLLAMINSLGVGYQFIGVATPATNPGTPDKKVFYIASTAGTYSDFGGLEVTEDEVVALTWDSSWHKAQIGITKVGPVGPQGPQGEPGPQGPQGEPGPQGETPDISGLATKEDVAGKADKATTLAGYGIGDAYTKSEVDAALNTKQDTIIAGEGISIKGNVISSTVDSLITPITYAELVALRGSSSLVAGMQYRITDYACTTTQENTQSAGHPFDIIVTADSENTLNEEARAIQHEGDTYFANCDLNAWKIWYCLDNDASRFAWADSANGKGVIYRMIDEWNNDVPYDFKNIMFKRYILDANNAIATDVAKEGELNAVKTRLGEMSHRIHTSLWYYGEYVTDVYPNAEAGRKYVPFGDILYNNGGPGVL